MTPNSNDHNNIPLITLKAAANLIADRIYGAYGYSDDVPAVYRMSKEDFANNLAAKLSEIPKSATQHGTLITASFAGGTAPQDPLGQAVVGVIREARFDQNYNTINLQSLYIYPAVTTDGTMPAGAIMYSEPTRYGKPSTLKLLKYADSPDVDIIREEGSFLSKNRIAPDSAQKSAETYQFGRNIEVVTKQDDSQIPDYLKQASDSGVFIRIPEFSFDREGQISINFHYEHYSQDAEVLQGKIKIKDGVYAFPPEPLVMLTRDAVCPSYYPPIERGSAIFMNRIFTPNEVNRLVESGTILKTEPGKETGQGTADPALEPEKIRG